MPDILTAATPTNNWWSPVQSGSITLDEYFAMPEGAPYEFWDGILVHRVTGHEFTTVEDALAFMPSDSVDDMSPAPNFQHQIVASNLFDGFNRHVRTHRLGRMLFAPLSVVLEVDGHEHTVEPDLLFLSHARGGQVHDGKLYGPPDLIVEILSPSNAHNDLIRKRDLYDAAGVHEYWIADPKTQRVDVFVASGDGYVLDQRTEGTAASRVLDGLTLSVADLFE